MRKLNILIILILFVNGFLSAQERTILDKSVSKKFDSQGMSSSEILSKVERWVKQELDPENNVIETYDTDKGLMKVKGDTKVLYKNIGQELYPKRTGMAEVLEAKFGHLVEVSVHEDSYEISYTVTDMKREMYKKQDLFYECVNFNKIDEQSLMDYNKAMDKLLKANLVFKKRREIFAENSRSQFEEVSNFLLNEGEVTIFSIQEAITSE